MAKLSTNHIVLLASFAALTPMAIDMYLPAMPALAHELGVSTMQASLSVSMFFFGAAIGQLFAGPLSDRYGRRPMIAGGLGLFILAAILAATARHFEILLAARLAQALGACSVTVAGRAIVRDNLETRDAARMFSLLALIGSLAPILAPLIGATVIRFGDWRTIFLVMGAAAFAVLCYQLTTLPETRSKESEARARGETAFHAYTSLLRNPRIVGYLLAAAGNGACLFTYIANASSVVIGGYGLSPTNFALLFGTNAVGLLMANQLNRRMLATMQVDAVLRNSAVTAAVFAVLFAAFSATHVGGLPALASLLFIGVASTAIVQANVLAGALSVDPLRSGSISALYGATTFAFGTLASSIAATIETGRGGGMAIVIAAGFALCGAALHFLVLRPSRDVA